MIRSFQRDNPVLLRLYKNAGILFGGNAASAGISLLGLAVLTRALGVESFGVYALITAFVGLIDRLASFQTWQALIHYGSKAREEGDKNRLTSLLLFGWMLDAGSGFCGTLIALAAALFVPAWFGLEQAGLPVLFPALFVLLFNWTSTPTAILRIFDRFVLQASYLNVIAVLKLAGYLGLFLSGVRDLSPYVCVWAFSTVAGRMVLFALSAHLARKQGLLGGGQTDMKTMFARCPGLWRFVLTTNLDGMVRVLREADIFIVNAVLGTAATGLYKIARELARIPSQLTGPFYQAIYPELARFAAKNDFRGFTRLMKQSSLSLGLFVAAGWVAFVVLGKWLIALAFGADYVQAYPAAVWCVGAVAIWAFAQPISPAMLALGRARDNLIVHLGTSLFYIAMLYMGGIYAGLAGAGAALFVFYCLWSGAMLVCLKNALGHVKKNES